MKPYDFDYRTATTVGQALQLLEEHEGGAKILAGGQSLMATLNMRLSAPELLIDINGIDELRGIKLEKDCLRIGALTRHVEVLQSELVAEHVPLLKLAMEHVAHAAIRNRGTHGGSVAFADPAAEIPACTVALNAKLVIENSREQRKVAAHDFFQDLYETDLEENELLVAIEYPLPGANQVAWFREFTRRKGDFATAGLALSAEYSDGRFSHMAPVFFGIANTPVLASNSAAHLVDTQINPDNIQAALNTLAEELGVIGDLYASEEMKVHLASHFFEQAIIELSNPS